MNDHRFFVDLAANNEFVFMPEPLAEYRMHGNNTTSKDEKGWLKEKILLRKYFLKQYGDRMSRRETKVRYILQNWLFFSCLGKQREARQYFMQAFKIDYSHFKQ